METKQTFNNDWIDSRNPTQGLPRRKGNGGPHFVTVQRSWKYFPKLSPHYWKNNQNNSLRFYCFKGGLFWTNTFFFPRQLSYNTILVAKIIELTCSLALLSFKLYTRYIKLIEVYKYFISFEFEYRLSFSFIYFILKSKLLIIISI